MTTLAPARRVVKPARVTPRPAAPFGAGILPPEPAPAEGNIPAKYGRIRIIDGARAGVYARVTDRPGFAPHWAPESGDAGWLSEMDADRLYVAGRVAILEAPKAEAPAPTPEPTAPAAFDLSALPALADAPAARKPRRGPSRLDLIWARAYDLSLDAECPLPPPSDVVTAEEIAAWHAGADAAGELIHARYRDAALEADWQERAEAGMMPAPPWPLD